MVYRCCSYIANNIQTTLDLELLKTQLPDELYLLCESFYSARLKGVARLMWSRFCPKFVLPSNSLLGIDEDDVLDTEEYDSFDEEEHDSFDEEEHNAFYNED